MGHHAQPGDELFAAGPSSSAGVTPPTPPPADGASKIVIVYFFASPAVTLQRVGLVRGCGCMLYVADADASLYGQEHFSTT